MWVKYSKQLLGNLLLSKNRVCVNLHKISPMDLALANPQNDEETNENSIQINIDIKQKTLSGLTWLANRYSHSKNTNFINTKHPKTI